MGGGICHVPRLSRTKATASLSSATAAFRAVMLLSLDIAYTSLPAEVSAVNYAPVLGDVSLRIFQGDATGADFLVQTVFDTILHDRIPSTAIALRPQVLDRVGTAKLTRA